MAYLNVARGGVQPYHGPNGVYSPLRGLTYSPTAAQLSYEGVRIEPRELVVMDSAPAIKLGSQLGLILLKGLSEASMELGQPGILSFAYAAFTLLCLGDGDFMITLSLRMTHTCNDRLVLAPNKGLAATNLTKSDLALKLVCGNITMFEIPGGARSFSGFSSLLLLGAQAERLIKKIHPQGISRIEEALSQHPWQIFVEEDPGILYHPLLTNSTRSLSFFRESTQQNLFLTE
ncbi:hypothetical protein VNO77_25929 [Canavalia gladiata]|uniref:Uncharacterized protein n=1 Tax=Canavalia gladiata TaxID=3824 RepID=A0AAN9KSC3_CANGL